MDPEATGNPDRLEDMERRLRRIERRLGIERIPARAPEPVAPPTEPAPVEVGTVGVIEAVDARPIPRAATWATAQLPGPEPKPQRHSDLEHVIGGKWFAAAGAVVVVIGVGLFVKLAHDRGWLVLPPWGKCAAGAAFGAALLIAGEIIRRWVGALASAGPSAAGLGAIFASVYAAYGVYHLLPSSQAFALLAATAALGFGVAAVGRSASLAVLSLIGAYVNPIIIGDADASPLVMPVYLFTLLCLGLALSAWRASPFRVLRGLVWWGTVILGTMWVASRGAGQSWAESVLFIGASWAVIHAELALSARVGTGAPAQTIERVRFEIPWPSTRFIATSFTTTAWTAALAVYVMRRGPGHEWAAPAIGAAATALLAGATAGRLRVLREPPRTHLERLGAALAAQSGALVLAALALGISGWTGSLAWLLLGVAAIGSGRWISSRGLEVYGIVALSLAGARILVMDGPWEHGSPLLYSAAGMFITRWTVLMASGAAAWFAGAAMIRPARSSGLPGSLDDPWRTPLALTGVALMYIAAGDPRADAASLSMVWLGLAVAVFIAHGVFRRVALDLGGWAGVVLAAASWAFAYPFDWSLSHAALGLHPGLLTSLAIAGVALVARAWLARRSAGAPAVHRDALKAVIPGAIALLLASTSLETARAAETLSGDPTAQKAAVSIWWGLVGGGMVVAGFVGGRPLARQVGLGLIAVATVKAALLDLVEVPQIWRVASFVGLGLLMLGVAVAYTRASAIISRLRGGPPPEARDESAPPGFPST